MEFNTKNNFEKKEPVSLYQSAESLRKENKTTKDLVLAIGKFIIKHARSVSEPYQPKSILPRITKCKNTLNFHLPQTTAVFCGCSFSHIAK